MRLRITSRFTMVSVGFFIYLIIPPTLCLGVESDSNRNEYQEYLLGVKTVGA